jgi:inner membrane transporter RhtA
VPSSASPTPPASAGPQPTTESHLGPVLLVIGGVVSVQLGAAVAKGLFPALGPAGTVLVRIATAAVLLLVLARRPLHRLPAGAARVVVPFGLVLAAMNLAFYLALDRIPLGVAVTVEFIGPLSVAVAGSRRPRDLVWALLAAVGVLLLTGGGRALLSGSLDPLGVLCAALAGACWAGYILLNQRVGAAVPGVHGLAVAMAVGTVALLPVGVAAAGSRLLDPHLLLAGAGVGLLSSAIPYTLELAALRSLPTATFGVLMSLEPAVAALAGRVLLGERLSPAQVLAVVLVCAASAGATWSAAAARRRARPRLPL